MAISSIKNSIGNILNTTAKSKFISSRLEKGYADKARFAAAMVVTSIVSKDLVGCFLYTTQSLHNKKIPEEKRKFVAAIDLFNGILMVGGQLLIAKIIDLRFTPKTFGKKFSGTIEPKSKPVEYISNAKGPLSSDNIVGTTKKFIADNASKLKEMGHDVANIDYKDIGEKAVKKLGRGSAKMEAISTGFSILVASLATMALVKRTIVPFLSTPLASWFKGKYMTDKEVQKKIAQDPASDVLPLSTYTPWYNNKMDAVDKTAFNKVHLTKS